MNLRSPLDRRRLAARIDRFVKANPGLIPFPLHRVRYLETVIHRRAKSAEIAKFARPADRRFVVRVDTGDAVRMA